MSVKVSSWVWHEAPVEVGGNELVVLLALADVANDNGECVFFTDSSESTQAALALKSRMSRRTFQRAVDSLVERGVLSVTRGSGRYDTNTYRVLIEGRQIDHPDDSGASPVTLRVVTRDASDASTVTHYKEINVLNVRDVSTRDIYPKNVIKGPFVYDDSEPL